jgi:hypothetical protein
MAEKEHFPSGYLGWKNVAVKLEADSSATTGNVGRRLGVRRIHSARSDRTAIGRLGPISMQSKTNLEPLALHRSHSEELNEVSTIQISYLAHPSGHFSQQGIGMTETRQLEMNGDENFGNRTLWEEAGFKLPIFSSSMR